MNTSNQTYKELAVPYFKEVFDRIDAVMIQFKIPYYLIGATALALQLLKKGIKPSRGTKDIDFAIMISSIKDFENIVKELEKQGFNKVQAPWTLYHYEYNVVIDLLPFGEVDQKFTSNFNERVADLHLLGFKEVLENPDEILIEEHIVKVPTIPGMVILKLVAWSDRPEDRGNDLFDILRIIENYFHCNYNEILEEHYDTFPEDGFDQLKIASRVLGRKAGQYMVNSRELTDRIKRTLDENTFNPESSIIAKKWAQEKDWELDYAHSLLVELKVGFFEI